MGDPLEKFIRDNRHEFDDKEPSQKVWDKIYSRLNAKNNINLTWLWKAAAILFFLTSSFLLYQLEFDENGEWGMGRDPALVANSSEQLNTEFKTVETYYVREISEKKELIYDFKATNRRIGGNFEQDLKKLDAMYAVLKDELKNNPSKKVVDALILNLLVRVDILNDTLQELEEAETSGV
ncbi:MAG: hypothetical protein WD555_02080 [Fulvivirga sp.]